MIGRFFVGLGVGFGLAVSVSISLDWTVLLIRILEPGLKLIVFAD
jgi:hypothetical protein